MNKWNQYSTTCVWSPRHPCSLLGLCPKLSSWLTVSQPLLLMPLIPSGRVDHRCGPPGFSPLGCPGPLNPMAFPSLPAWVLGAWQEHGIKHLTDVLGVRGLSFFCWFAVSLTVLPCPGPLIISYPITRWGLEVCDFNFAHMTKLSKSGSC